MDVSYNWLQDYIGDPLPEPAVVSDVLTHGAYEVEAIREVGDDTVLDIDVLPNRASDSLGHEGIARELAVLQDLSFSGVEPAVDTADSLRTDDAIRLAVDGDNCRRALKRLAIKVEVGESPDWLKQRLQTLGQKSINNIVDITNFVMLELGQPVHAFDYDKLAGGKQKDITIRSAKKGEEVTTLDGDTFKLEPGMLVIADDEKPLDIAGLKGGKASGIDKSTTKVVLSVCSFDPATIRQTSQKLNLRTDASKRFENDVPPAQSARAMERLSELLVEIAGAEVAEDVLDIYPRPISSYKVGVTTDHINDLLGTDIPEAKAIKILEDLGCEVEAVLPQETVPKLAAEFVGTPYEYGASVSRDAPKSFDCSSFVSWLYVQAGIALPRMSGGQFVYTEEIKEDDLKPGDIIFSNTKKDEGGEIYYETQEYMQGTEIPGGVDHCGIYLGDGEVIHVSRHNHNGDGGVEVELLAEAGQFQNITKYGRVSGADKKRLVATIPDWRTDLRCSQDLIEEVGRVYGYGNIEAVMPEAAQTETTPNVLSAIRDTLVSAGLTEVKTYSLVDSGDIKVANPVAEDKAYLRTTLRDNIRQVLDENERHRPVLKADSLRVFEVGKVFTDEKEAVSVGVGLDTDNSDTEIADIFQQLSDILDTDLSPDIEDGIGTAVLPDVEMLTLAKEPPEVDDSFAAVDFRVPSSYPYVLRDIAVWTPAGTDQEEVQDIIIKAIGELLVGCSHFDTYEKQDQISYAFKLVFQSDERTLSDEEVNEQMKAVEEALEENDGFSVR